MQSRKELAEAGRRKLEEFRKAKAQGKPASSSVPSKATADAAAPSTTTGYVAPVPAPHSNGNGNAAASWLAAAGHAPAQPPGPPDAKSNGGTTVAPQAPAAPDSLSDGRHAALNNLGVSTTDTSLPPRPASGPQPSQAQTTGFVVLQDAPIPFASPATVRSRISGSGGTSFPAARISGSGNGGAAVLPAWQPPSADSAASAAQPFSAASSGATGTSGLLGERNVWQADGPSRASAAAPQHTVGGDSWVGADAGLPSASANGVARSLFGGTATATADPQLEQLGFPGESTSANTGLGTGSPWLPANGTTGNGSAPTHQPGSLFRADQHGGNAEHPADAGRLWSSLGAGPSSTGPHGTGAAQPLPLSSAAQSVTPWDGGTALPGLAQASTSGLAAHAQASGVPGAGPAHTTDGGVLLAPWERPQQGLANGPSFAAPKQADALGGPAPADSDAARQFASESWRPEPLAPQTTIVAAFGGSGADAGYGAGSSPQLQAPGVGAAVAPLSALANGPPFGASTTTPETAVPSSLSAPAPPEGAEPTQPAPQPFPAAAPETASAPAPAAEVAAATAAPPAAALDGYDLLADSFLASGPAKAPTGSTPAAAAVYPAAPPAWHGINGLVAPAAASHAAAGASPALPLSFGAPSPIGTGVSPLDPLSSGRSAAQAVATVDASAPPPQAQELNSQPSDLPPPPPLPHLPPASPAASREAPPPAPATAPSTSRFAWLFGSPPAYKRGQQPQQPSAQQQPAEPAPSPYQQQAQQQEQQQQEQQQQEEAAPLPPTPELYSQLPPSSTAPPPPAVAPPERQPGPGALQTEGTPHAADSAAASTSGRDGPPVPTSNEFGAGGEQWTRPAGSWQRADAASAPGAEPARPPSGLASTHHDAYQSSSASLRPTEATEGSSMAVQPSAGLAMQSSLHEWGRGAAAAAASAGTEQGPGLADPQPTLAAGAAGRPWNGVAAPPVAAGGVPSFLRDNPQGFGSLGGSAAHTLPVEAERQPDSAASSMGGARPDAAAFSAPSFSTSFPALGAEAAAAAPARPAPGLPPLAPASTSAPPAAPPAAPAAPPAAPAASNQFSAAASYLSAYSAQSAAAPPPPPSSSAPTGMLHSGSYSSNLGTLGVAGGTGMGGGAGWAGSAAGTAPAAPAASFLDSYLDNLLSDMGPSTSQPAAASGGSGAQPEAGAQATHGGAGTDRAADSAHASRRETGDGVESAAAAADVAAGLTSPHDAPHEAAVGSGLGAGGGGGREAAAEAAWAARGGGGLHHTDSSAHVHPHSRHLSRRQSGDSVLSHVTGYGHPGPPLGAAAGRAQFAGLQHHIDELTEEKLALSRGLAQQTRLNEQLAAENEALTAQYNARGAVVDELQRKLKQYEQELQAQALSLEGFADERQAARSSYAEAAARAQALASEVVGLEAAVLQAKSAGLKAQRAAEEAGARAAKLEKQMAALTAQAAERAQEVAALQAKGRHLAGRLKAAEAGLREAEERAGEQRRLLAAAEARAARAGGQGGAQAAAAAPPPPPKETAEREVQCSLAAEEEEAQGGAGDGVAAGAALAEAQARRRESSSSGAGLPAAAADEQAAAVDEQAGEAAPMVPMLAAGHDAYPPPPHPHPAQLAALAAASRQPRDPPSAIIAERALDALETSMSASLPYLSSAEGLEALAAQLGRWLPAGPVSGGDPVAAMAEEEVRLMGSIHGLLAAAEAAAAQAAERELELQERVSALCHDNGELRSRLALVTQRLELMALQGGRGLGAAAAAGGPGSGVPAAQQGPASASAEGGPGPDDSTPLPAAAPSVVGSLPASATSEPSLVTPTRSTRGGPDSLPPLSGPPGTSQARQSWMGYLFRSRQKKRVRTSIL